ncbi:MAG: hypothetical protein CSB06_00960 [Bacteroidia bacterium]|nr:MAG: hypothetical protein CSB06_00960 [Bacteroidia bacterium]
MFSTNWKDHFEVLQPVLCRQERKTLQRLRSPKRKAEWLAARRLLYLLKGEYVPVHYNDHGKPGLADGTETSISHTSGFVGIILAKKNVRVGIDLEILSDKILNLYPKFIEPELLLSQTPADKIRECYLHWCGKEVLFKITDNQSVSFKDDFTININSLQEKGVAWGTFSKQKTTLEKKINYLFFPVPPKTLLIMWS